MEYTEAERYRNLMQTLEAIDNVDETEYFEQDQRSLYEQVADLINIAEQNGLYDAADWLKKETSKWPAFNTVRDRK